jgi:hypothetical protein
MNKSILILLLLMLTKSFNNREYVGDKVIKMVEVELNYENILNEMTKIGLKYPNILLNQIRLETGNLTKIYGNNLFGFTSDEYLSYDTWLDCIKYAKMWQDKKYKGGNYYTFLVKINYAEDPLYIQKLQRFR